MTDNSRYSAFASDVLHGLSAPKKFIPSKYLYDARGSLLFQQIMAMRVYYPTFCEREILENKSVEIYSMLNFDTAFDIIEFGAGDGSKTISLLKTISTLNPEIVYKPVDISRSALLKLTQNVASELPRLQMQLIEGDYSVENTVIESRPALLLFLGGNIGNYERDDAVALLKSFGRRMKKGDKILIGFDLRKDPAVIQLAYDDPNGITKAFNINLLTRINDELSANIIPDKFNFYCHYDPVSGGVYSYLYSLEKQAIFSQVLNRTFSFEENELIFTELSQKFNFDEIQALATASGFTTISHITDSRNYFTDSLWEKA